MSPRRELRMRTQVLGGAFIVLFLAIQVAVIIQSNRLTQARSAFQSATYPITDLANTQRQAERLRSSVILGDAETIELDYGLYRRQVAVTLAPAHVAQLQSETAEALTAQTSLLVDFVETQGVEAIAADPALMQSMLRRVDELSRVAKEGYDREEQLFFDLMLDGVDRSSQLATVLVALGAMTLLVGGAFALQLFRRTRERLAEANDKLRAEVAERIEGEQRLAIAFDEARRSESKAKASAKEIETLHQVVLAGVGGGTDEVAARIAQELVDLHGFAAIGVLLHGEDGPRVAGVAGGALDGELVELHGPTMRALHNAPAQQVTVTPAMPTIRRDAKVVQVAPIHAGSRLLGALVVEGVQDEPRVHLEAVQRLADQLGLLLEAARAFDDQRQLARRFRELDELKTEFVATVSHELRTPLTAIVGMALTLDQYWNRVTEEERRDMVSRMRRQARRQQRLVDDLLTISRIQQRGITLRPESVSLVAVGDAVARDLDQEIDVQIGPDLVTWADRDHVERMLTNYLTNAAKYAPGSATHITASVLDDSWIEIAVVDDGPGVPEEFRARLFESFTQASTGATRTAQGVGLGLSIVRTLAEANGGSAWFRPRHPSGSIFGVTLPAVPTAVVDRPDLAASEA